MKSLVIFLVLVALVSADEMKCDVYNCKDLGANECAKVTRDTNNLIFELKACAGGKVCDLKFGETPDTCAASYSTPLRYPGELCSANSECFSNVCDEKTKLCTSGIEGADCEDDMGCSAGLYCSADQKCAKVKNETEDCTAAKCDAGLVCNSGVCAKIGQLKIGEAATALAACKSFFIIGGFCAEGPKLVREQGIDNEAGPTKCSATKNECKYALGNDTQTDACICGRTDKAEQKYCNPGKGDIDMKDVS